MRLTKYFIPLFLLLTLSSATAQKTLRVNAVKANNWGVIYSLPKTSFELTLVVKKTSYTRGDYYSFAQRYLAIDSPVTEDRVVYSIEDIEIINRGIADKSNSFMVEFRSKTVEPFLFLREDGTIIAINAEPEQDVAEKKALPEGESPALNPRRYLSQEALMAGSTAKQAELVARQIFDLRRNRSDILAGEAESMPPDGNAYNVVMSEINAQEKAITELFAGSLQTEYFTTNYTIIPDENSIDKMVIARFSEKLGPVDADNLAGEPIYFSLIDKTPDNAPRVISERDQKQLEDKLSKGVVYNIPGKAVLTIEFGNKPIKSIETDVVQFGSKDVLLKKMFDNNKQPIKVLFYPELGAIKQIIQ